jgi:TonB-linked SusC/RagA family outer membrane protein
MRRVRRLLSYRVMFVALMFLQSLAITTVNAKDNEAQDLLHYKVKIQVKDTKIKSVLAQLENMTNVKFVYSSRSINLDRKVTLNTTEKPLSQLLDELFYPEKVNYKSIRNRVILSQSVETAPESFQDQKIEENRVMDRQLTGVVKDENQQPLPGVTVLIKNLQRGTVTDEKGNYKISIPDGSVVLTFSYVGYIAQEVTVTGAQSTFDVSLAPDNKSLQEVVVTALGMKRQTKALGYSVGEVKAESLTKVPQENIVNALTGKVTGVRVINTTPDLNSDPMIMIRGLTSLSGGNSPLIVVNGLPTGTDVSVLSDLSADNIESVSVLKGPSAAALYGSRAGSGVLIITTKTGGNGKKGIGLSVNSSYVATVPYRYLPIQQEFVNGSNGAFEQTSNLWWGPQMGTSVPRFGTDGVATPLEAHPNNVKDFVNVGNTFVNDITISNNTDQLSFSLSLSDTRGSGIYPESELRKDAIALSASYQFTKRLGVSANFNYLNSGSDNFRGISYDNYPYEDLYFTPNWLDINDLKNYWTQENVQQRVWAASGFNNPWFTVYENVNKFKKVRPYGNIKLDYKITDDLTFMGRLGGFNESYITTNRTAKSEKSVPLGAFAYMNRSAQELNADFLFNYKKDVGEFSFDASVGGNWLAQDNSNASIVGTNLNLPGLYTGSNIDRTAVSYPSTMSRKKIYSGYGMASIGFKNAIFLELTGRNDWTSTLPKGNNSYFYPSASLSAVISDLVELPESISLFKVRGGWAQVGKDTNPYAYSLLLTRGSWGNNVIYSLPNTLPTTNLKPESVVSTEVGFDLGFFKKRLGFNFTYYDVENRNQITGIATSGSTGATAANVNAGIVQNKGLEITLSAVPVQTKDITWDVAFNFTKERSKLLKLPDGVSNYQFWNRNNIYSYTELGGIVGDLWGPDVVRVQEGEYKGWPILNNNGYVQQAPGNIKLGNVIPDFTLGFQTNVTIKRFSISASFDWRQGGEYYSESMKRMTRDGRQDGWYKGDGSSTFTGILSNNSFNGDNQALANEIRSNPAKYNAMNGLTYVGGRNAEYGGFEYGGAIANGVFFPGVILQNGEYVENFGGPGTKYFRADYIADPGNGYWSRGVQSWIYDASFIKLRELAVAYKLPEAYAKAIGSNGLSLSVFARNLMLWTKADNYIDPESTMMNTNDQFTPSAKYHLGYDRASFYPWSMSMGVKLNITF